MTFDLAEYERRLAFWSDIGAHMPFLKETAESYEEPAVIELGVRGGQSTAAFLAGIQGNSGCLWSVDTEPPQVPAHWHHLPEWRFLQADDVSARARDWLPAACDILFIDTDHAYEHTLAELSLHAPRVRPGGVVLLHDTEWGPDGDEQLDEPGGPVTAALDAWCAQTGRAWVNRAGSYGLGMVRC